MMRKQTLGVILILSIAVQTFAQNPAAQKFAKKITAEGAKKHLSILASDEFEGRETGKPGAEKAANYLAAEFKKLGLKAPVNGTYFQDVPLVEKMPEVKSFTVNSTPMVYGKDFYFFGTPDEKVMSANEVVFLGYGSTAVKNTDVAGKVVLLIKGKPAEWNQSLKSVQSKEPALILVTSPEIATVLEKNKAYFVNPAGRLSLKEDKDQPLKTPIVNITVAMANSVLKNSGKTYETLKTEIDNNPTLQTHNIKAELNINFGTKVKNVKAVNVMGLLEGTDLKSEIVVFSAHYDHIGLTTTGTDKVNNGADDDGSGTTGVLEIAKAFTEAKKGGKGPRRSILFLCVVGEEKGLLGSEWYSEHPVFPLQNTITDLNIDMIGRVGEEYKNKADSANYCYLIGSDKLSTDLHKISENANATYTKMKIDYKYNDPKDPNRFYYRSDHYNFAKHGIPIVFYFNGVHEDYHQPGDEVSKINFNLLAKRAQLVFYTGWDLVNRDKRPVVNVKNDMPADR
ncbi:MAG: M28 family peptidase [Daejeonella sp.]